MQSPCGLCHGTGFVTEIRDGMRFAERCECRKVDRKALRSSAARIPERYRDCELDTFYTLNNRSLERAVARCRKVVNEGPRGRHGLLLLGPCGVGKTHLGVALLRALVRDYGITGLFAEFHDLLRRIQETYDRKSESGFGEILRPALEAEVLLLDDLGASRMTPWARDTLGQIINERYNQSLLTLITSNRSTSPSSGEESLEDRIGARLISRLAEMCWTVDIDADDYRRNVQAARIRG